MFGHPNKLKDMCTVHDVTKLIKYCSNAKRTGIAAYDITNLSCHTEMNTSNLRRGDFATSELSFPLVLLSEFDSSYAKDFIF